MPRGSARVYTIILPSFAQVANAAKIWLITCGPWWVASSSVHAVALYGTMWALGPHVPPPVIGVAPTFDTQISPPPRVEDEPEIVHYVIGETPVEPTKLATDTLRIIDPPKVQEEEQVNTTPDEKFEESGGGLYASFAGKIGGVLGIDAKGPGSRPPTSQGRAAIAAAGVNNEVGSGGKGEGFKGRGRGVRKAMTGGYGGTKGTERAVAGALHWFMRHQNPNGSWSLEKFATNCQDGSCDCGTDLKCDIAATSFALLPYLGAGQTHKSRGPYRRSIANGLAWIMNSQKSDGDLRGPGGSMYVHGLAAMALCEAYGMTGDREVGDCAQRAIYFIERAQDPVGGGWRYQPREPGDTSVVGWQVMALKSARIAGLAVSANTLANAQRFLQSTTSGHQHGLYSYQADAPVSPTMTAVGMLCSQYMGMRREDPAMSESMNYLMGRMADSNDRSAYYWYYGSLAMHNLPGPEWDVWNRRMRKTLLESQIRYGCASGSWPPQGHKNCEKGGRVMVTSLCTLTLEVYYRYLPLYRIGGQ